MVNVLTGRERVRKQFGSIREVMDVPNLIEIQLSSFDRFLQMGVPPDKRDIETGLEAVLRSVFPIKHNADWYSNASHNDLSAVLEYVSYDFLNPKYNIDECRKIGLTYSIRLMVKLRLIIIDVDEDTMHRAVKDVKEQEVYLCDIPLMTNSGSFVINGIERVVVSQLTKSPGVFFDHDQGKTHPSGKIHYSAHIIPNKGVQLDFEFNDRDLIFTAIDGIRTFPATTLLQAIGMDRVEILNSFYDVVHFNFIEGKKEQNWIVEYDERRYLGKTLSEDLIDASSLNVVAESGEKFNRKIARKFEELKVEKLIVGRSSLVGKYVSEDLVNCDTREILAEAGDVVTETLLDSAIRQGCRKISLLEIDHLDANSYILDTLKIDMAETKEQALFEIYSVLSPGNTPTIEKAEDLFISLFYDEENYDLSIIGRIKINMRLGINCDSRVQILSQQDIVSTLRTLIEVREGRSEIDEMDSLGNKRVCTVGEFLQNQFRRGLERMQWKTFEKLRTLEIDKLMPGDLIDGKPITTEILKFFYSSELSQYMYQINPLSEITHKRRLTVIGPGGPTREWANSKIRDVHNTHYGRLCPIETPEGQNIGLINSLATYARINKYGFIDTPYRKVINGTVSDEAFYLGAMEEERFNVAQSDAKLLADSKFKEEFVACRLAGEVNLVPKYRINFMDVSPKQVVSVSASLIPFLENNVPTRALMGANMQRQAVPLIQSEAPLVGTGMEKVVALDSRAAMVAFRSGVVERVDARQIEVRVNSEIDSTDARDIYQLNKYQKSNQNTCINQHPIVKTGDQVERGETIADGPCTDLGELALGKNVLVAYMPWNGYNYKDSILISERIVRDNVFTSIFIEEFQVDARITKLGLEEFTREIPNVSPDVLKNLNDSGIIKLGAEVKAGDILIGKTTPLGKKPESLIAEEPKSYLSDELSEPNSTNEEFFNILNKKKPHVKDTSLRMPSGKSGTVIDVQIFKDYGVELDEPTMKKESEEIDQKSKDHSIELSRLNSRVFIQVVKLMIGQSAINGPDGYDPLTKLTGKFLILNFELHELWQFEFLNEKIMREIKAIRGYYDDYVKILKLRLEENISMIKRRHEMPRGVMKMAKVKIAVKRKLQPGDKMASRHGTKGVVSKIIPMEDMPFLEDGTPVDIVLNPLGVPSRMNVGEILETHLGWACKNLGIQIGKLHDQYLKFGEIGQLREKISEIYGGNIDGEVIGSLSDEEIEKLSGQIRSGVPIATPVFDGATEEEVSNLLELAGLERSGQVTLFDGKTGEAFDRKITVGYIYMMKLVHMVEDIIHARSIGPYSLVSQQPVRGKSNFGGQRLGEMEVWALAGYGAAYTLREMLTIKSDDMTGREKANEAIVHGNDTFYFGIPESFNVLVKEMRSLGLNVELNDSEFVERFQKERQ